MPQGLLTIISSPSGGGKDAVINALLSRIPNSTRLVTTTTRPPRPGNQDGVDYHFITEKEFKQKIEQDAFVEYNFYAGNYYGTEKKWLEKTLSKYDLVLTQIEVNGKHNLDKANIPHLAIFLLPESLEVLRHRIEKRGGITSEVIAERLEIAKKEIEASKDYDHRITNYEGKLEETIDKIAEIIQAYLRGEKRVDNNS
ncbi:MAG TPA: guanylate kinase [Patescibacteria group bacterium]|nr:guanylate kinase [Patescibacteria group bacterium]